MKAISRRAVPVVLAAGVVLTLAGCGSTNSSAGAAAVVGDQRISTQSLQDTVDRALRDPQAQAQLGSDRAAFTRNELGRLINNVIIAAAAAEHHVTVTDAEIDKQIGAFAQQAGGLPQLYQQAAQGGVPKPDLRTFVRYYVLQQKLGDALASDLPVSAAQLQAAYKQNADQLDQVHAAHILVKDKATADRLLAQVRQNPGSFASLAAKYSQDSGSKGTGGDLGFQGRGKLVKPFADAIFSAKPGTFLVVHSSFGWHVVHVIAHRTVSLAEATPQLKSQILKDQRAALLRTALSDESKKLGVHVSPRYGRWDARNGQVVPTDANKDVSSPSPTPSGAG